MIVAVAAIAAKVPYGVVLSLWTGSSAIACLGAAFLAYLAGRDWLAAGDHRIRRETAGILFRSGVVRTITTGAFLLASASSYFSLEHDPIDIGTALVSIALAGVTAAFTVRDMIARGRITEAMPA